MKGSELIPGDSSLTRVAVHNYNLGLVRIEGDIYEWYKKQTRYNIIEKV